MISVQGVSPQMLNEKLCVLAQAGLGSEQRVRLWLGALSSSLSMTSGALPSSSWFFPS